MTDTTCHMSISLDGFVAGPDQSREHPLGKRGRELHGWHLGDERANEADAAYVQARETAGADGIDIAGGASTVRQALLAGVIDELWLDIVPVLLGSGEGIFNGVAEFDFEP